MLKIINQSKAEKVHPGPKRGSEVKAVPVDIYRYVPKLEFLSVEQKCVRASREPTSGRILMCDVTTTPRLGVITSATKAVAM